MPSILNLLLITGAAGTAFGQLLYVPDYGTNKISEFATNTSSPAGLLTPLCTASYSLPAGVNQPAAVAMTPDGKYLYAAARAGFLAAFSVGNGSSGCYGQLTPLGTPTYALGGGPWALAVATDPVTGNFYLYASAATGGTVTAYQINPDGSLTVLNSITPGNGPAGIAVAQSGNTLYLYITESGLSTLNVDGYAISANGSIGALSGQGTVPGGAWDVTPGTSKPENIVGSGNLLYVTDFNATGAAGGGLTVFTVLAGGVLAHQGDYQTGSAPQGLALATDNSFLYVANQADPSIWAFTLTGGLPGAHVANPSTAGLLKPWGVTVDPATDTVYVADTNADGIFGYTKGLATLITNDTPSANGNTGASSQPGQFLLAHIGPPPAATTVPAASYTSLGFLALLLAGCAWLMYRKSTRQSSVQ